MEDSTGNSQLVKAGAWYQNGRARVWIEDEHRYGLISVVRRCWTLRGIRVKAPYQTKYQWGYVYGAAEVVMGQVEFLYLPTVSLDCSLLFLEQHSPELNPIEKLWVKVKRGVANEVWETLDAIEDAIIEVLEPLWQSVERVRSLLGDNWLTRGVATFLMQREISSEAPNILA